VSFRFCRLYAVPSLLPRLYSDPRKQLRLQGLVKGLLGPLRVEAGAEGEEEGAGATHLMWLEGLPPPPGIALL